MVVLATGQHNQIRCILWVVPLISIRASGFSQVILFLYMAGGGSVLILVIFIVNTVFDILAPLIYIKKL